MFSDFSRRQTLVALVISSFFGSSPLLAETVSSSFEFLDTDGEFSLGTAPISATFLNGEAKSIGVPMFYVQGANSWMVDSGETGTISFTTPANSVNFMVRGLASNSGTLRILDNNDGEIVPAITITNDFEEVDLSISAGQGRIASIEITNTQSSDYVAVDTFTFDAEISNSDNELQFTHSFEDLNPAINSIQEFTVADINGSELSATLVGGSAFVRGIPNLYHTGMVSWMVEPAGSSNLGESSGSGTIELLHAASSVRFYVRNSDASTVFIVQLLDEDESLIREIPATDIGEQEWEEVVHVVLEGAPLVKTIVLNNMGTGIAAIDDLEFSASPTENSDTTDNTGDNSSSSSQGGSGSFPWYFALFGSLLHVVKSRSKS